jgi:hypothetical protein
LKDGFIQLFKLETFGNNKEDFTMIQNVGGADKFLRIILGLVLLALVFIGPKTAWGWIGLIPLATGIFNFCPLYLPFKISTARKKM